MKYLLDTNAISETLKSRPNQGFLDWLDTVVSLPEELDDTLYVSVLSLAEMRRGALKLAPGSRRTVIESRIAAMVEDYNDRLLTVDLAVGERWAMLAERHLATVSEDDVAAGRVMLPLADAGKREAD